jgi:putative heme-binding domain-containing protein
MWVTRAGTSAVLTVILAGGNLLGQVADDHSNQYPASDITVGVQIYSTLCVACHGPAGNGVNGVDLRRGPFRRATSDAALRALITSGIPESGMPSFKLAPAELTGLVAFIRAGFDANPSIAVALGDVSRGKMLFDGPKGRCFDCHRVKDQGSFAGPDLTEIGRLRQPAAIQRSLVDPNSAMQPINRPVRATTRDGTVITGRRLNEDLFSVQIISDDGRLRSFVKSELRDWAVSTISTMPSYKDSLSASELADLVAYVVSLKGPQPQ